MGDPFLRDIFLPHVYLLLAGFFGIALVVVGIFVIHLRTFSIQSFLEPFQALKGGASLWALCTGGTIAGYSLVDKVGVSHVYPPIYIYLLFVTALLLLSPYVFFKAGSGLRKEWGLNKRQILMVGFLELFTYLIILFALRIGKVSYIAAAREVSIVFSALLGILLLQEKNAPQKLAGAVLISLGVVLIGLSR